MRKIVLSVCLSLASVPALASTADIVASNNQIALAWLSTKVDYTETGSGIYGTPTGTLDTETGPVRGVAFSVSGMSGPGNDYLQFEYDRVDGSTTYTGAFMGGAFGSVVGSSTATITDISGRFGRGFALEGGFMATPYVELGRHQWDRGVNYGEIYTHYYAGVGLLGQYAPAANLVLGANALLGQTFNSYIVVNGGPGFSGFSGSLGNSLLTRIGASADYAFTPQLHGTVAVDYVSFKYGMSAVFAGSVNGVNALMWEPDSKTNYTRIRIGLGVGF